MNYYKVVYDGPSRPMIETPSGDLLSLSRFTDGRWQSYEQEEHDCSLVARAFNHALLGTAETCNGCGDGIQGWSNVFRCVSCDRTYHRECLLTHCAKEMADITAERDRLKKDLKTLTEGRFTQS